MYAIIKTGGKQLKVKEGDTVDVELLAVEQGKPVTFKEVLLMNDGKEIFVGDPIIKGAVVKGKLTDAVRGPKIQSMKFKRRKNCRRKWGHRQHYSRVTITGIEKGKGGK